MTDDEDFLRAEIEKAAAALGYGADDSRWRPGETAVEALIRERDEALRDLERIAEALGMSDGDQGRYKYASTNEMLRAIRERKELR